MDSPLRKRVGGRSDGDDAFSHPDAPLATPAAKPNAPFVVAIISILALLTVLLAAASISSRRTSSVASSPDDVARNYGIARLLNLQTASPSWRVPTSPEWTFTWSVGRRLVLIRWPPDCRIIRMSS